MCFPIYRSSLDQKYLSQHVQSSTFLMWTGLKISGGEHCVRLQPERLRRRLKPRENELKLIMTPIKSLAMISRSLEKAFKKSHFMIMIHSEWRLFLFACFLWDEPATYFWGGWGGLAKTEKQNLTQENKEKKMVQKKAWENVYASLTYFGDLYNGIVRKEIHR